jgi:eukaryotic-like serine/threonine-protein kinase
MSSREQNDRRKEMSSDDREFLIHTRLFDAIPQEAKLNLLVAMKASKVSAGSRFIHQGDEGDSLFIIQSGSCTVSVERDQVLHPVAVLSRGDTVGEMALLTGEKRNAQVEALTDLDLWGLSKDDFEKCCYKYPEIRHFLTQVLTARFARSTLIADRTIGKYLINQILDRGGWSIVYKGVHTTLNMPVAIKMLRHNMALDSNFLKNFQDEARIIANLNHENIVKVYDIEQLYRTVFIIMEYLDGDSLEKILREGPRLSSPRALKILLQTCSGLAYAHERGIVHGDIKPGNIFILDGDKAKILDFGLACAPGTKLTSLAGTPKYLSPEQIKRSPIDERSDIYSLGIAAFRMITGQDAFHSPDIAELLNMHLHAAIPNPKSLVPDLPDELSDFIIRATQKNPAERYETVGQIMAELQPLSQRLGVEIPSDSRRNNNMMSLFLFYRVDKQAIIKQLVNDFTSELKKVGAVLREADFKDI